MWDRLWVDAKLATMTGDGFGAIEDGAIAVEGGKIAWIGPMRDLPVSVEHAARAVESVDGGWITPGLIDCHTHLVYGGQRARDFAMRLAGASRAAIAAAGGGIYGTVRATREASPEALLAATERRLRTFAAEGLTTIEIKSGYGLDLATELKILRVARALEGRVPVGVKSTFGVYAVAPEFEGRADAYVDYLCSKVLPTVAGESLADAIDVQLDELGFSVDQTEKLFEAARRLGLGVKVHTDELSDFGGTAVAARHGALSADHLEYVNEDGVRAMSTAGTVAVLLPGNTFTLSRTQIPPIDLFRKHGVPMAVATNCNPGPSPTTSLLLMLNMACTLYRLTPEEALAGVTRNAAAALGLKATHGTLERGKTADFVVWDIASPIELAYYLGFNPRRQTVRGGSIVNAA